MFFVILPLLHLKDRGCSWEVDLEVPAPAPAHAPAPANMLLLKQVKKIGYKTIYDEKNAAKGRNLILILKKNMIGAACKACGHIYTIDMHNKLTTYIVKVGLNLMIIFVIIFLIIFLILSAGERHRCPGQLVHQEEGEVCSCSFSSLLLVHSSFNSFQLLLIDHIL